MSHESKPDIINIEKLVELFVKAQKKNNEFGLKAVQAATESAAKASAAVEEARRLAVFADAV